MTIVLLYWHFGTKQPEPNLKGVNDLRFQVKPCCNPVIVMFKFSIELSFVEFSPEQSIDYACFRGCNDHYKMKPFLFSPLRSVDMFFSFK